jgi:hypothetical protein
MAVSESTDARAAVETGGCAGGCLVVIAGLIVGLGVEWGASSLIASAWMYCYNVAWPVAYDMADSPRFFIFEGLGYALLYSLCVPAGFWIGRRVFAARGRPLRIGAGLLTAAILLSGVFAGDLMLNISANDGMYRPARCTSGHPPWWPGWLPARPGPNPCGTGPCLGAGA